jgi:hypothetical protein
LIEAQYRDKKSDLDRKAAEDKKAMDKEVSDAMIGLLQEGLSALSQFSQISTDKSISEAEKLKDARIKKLDEEKKKGKVSEEKFAKDKEAIELQANRKIAALKTEQAKKDKALAVVQSLINTAVAVTASLAQPPGVPVTIPFGVAAGVAGALQTSLIIAKPIPEFRDGGSFIRGVSPRYNIGGIPSGPSHSQGGIKMVDSSTGETVGELEGGEMYHIYSKETVKNNRPIMDRLLYSSLHRNGAPIFSAGGVIASAPVTAIPESTRAVATSTTLIDLGPLLDKIAVLTDEIRNKTDRLEAYITYASIENSFDEVSNIKKIAGRD